MLVKKVCSDNNITLTKAVYSDLSYVKHMLINYNGPMKPDVITALTAITETVETGSCFIARDEGGVVGGVAGQAYECLFNDDVFFCVMFMFVWPDKRYLTRKIMKELELILSFAPVTMIQYSVPHAIGVKKADKMGRFYNMSGYETFETHYCKRLRHAN